MVPAIVIKRLGEVKPLFFKKKKCVVGASGHVKACLIYSACYVL